MREVFRKEFLTALLSGRFTAGLSGSMALFALCAWFFVSGYRETPAQFLQVKPSTRWVSPFRPASPLGFCVHDVHIGASVQPGSGGELRFMEDRPNFRLPPHIRPDWAFLVVVVFGVMGIVLSYSAVNGEKEDGTLRQMLANGIPRHSVFIGKYLALASVTALSLLIGALVGLLVVTTLGPAGSVWGHAGEIVGFLLFACLFISLIVLLSLTVSALTHRTEVAALILLTVWAVWTFLAPGLSHLMVSRVWPLPSELEVASRLGPLIQQEVSGNLNVIFKRAKAGEFKSKEEAIRQVEGVYVEAQRKIVAWRRETARAKEARLEAARSLSRVSPASAFRYGAEAILDLGLVGMRRFRHDVEQYARVYDQYVLSRVGKLVMNTNWGFSSSFWVAGEEVRVRTPQSEEYTGDMSDFPAFSRSRRSFGEALSGAAPDLAILLGWNVALFVLGLVAFNRYDVR